MNNGKTKSLIRNSTAQQASLSNAQQAVLVKQLTGRDVQPTDFILTPIMISLDPRLDVYDRAVYHVIAYLVWIAGGDCRAPVPALAALANISARQAARALDELRELGHIKAERTSRRKPLLIGLLGSGAELQANGNEPCPACDRRIKMSSEGVCMACVRESREDAALQSAREELGPTASKDDIRARFLVKMAAKKIRRVEKRVEMKDRYEAEWMGPETA